MTQEIKNCPFCGDKATLVPHIKNKTYEVRCLNENCYAGCSLHTAEAAIIHWNTRAQDEREAKLVEVIKRIRGVGLVHKNTYQEFAFIQMLKETDAMLKDLGIK